MVSSMKVCMQAYVHTSSFFSRNVHIAQFKLNGAFALKIRCDKCHVWSKKPQQLPSDIVSQLRKLVFVYIFWKMLWATSSLVYVGLNAHFL